MGYMKKKKKDIKKDKQKCDHCYSKAVKKSKDEDFRDD